MSGKFILAALLAFGVGAFAAEEDNVQVTVKGTLHEDKNGFFMQADGQIFDLEFSEAGRADLHKFYADLKGDWVKVSGFLHVGEVTNGKASLVVYANDVSRLKREVAVTERREVVVEPQPVIVRERYVEHRRGINLPGIHINW